MYVKNILVYGPYFKKLYILVDSSIFINTAKHLRTWFFPDVYKVIGCSTVQYIQNLELQIKFFRLELFINEQKFYLLLISWFVILTHPRKL